ncbi:MAG: putative porin [Candidatus Omnitrophica bacterium]|nr:putative porin [Candidatus Omnitrophota bacterium]
MKKIVLTVATVMLFSWQGLSFADSSVDALIQKLEDKGILTSEDASQLKDEISTKEEASQTKTFKSLLPGWLNGLKISGDMRLREQVNYTKVPGSANFHQNRARLRARLNVEDQINDKVKVIVGIATDGGIPRSRNYTFGGNPDFGTQGIVLNKAYAVYTPNKMVTLEAGKMDNPIWEPGPGGPGGSLFWDPNLTPEGGSIQLEKKVNKYMTPWLQGDIFDLRDAAPSASIRTDPYMLVTQGGIKGDLTDKVYYKAGLTWYNINNPSHYYDSALSAGTNSRVIGPAGTSILKYNFSNVIVEGAELGINDPFDDLLPSPIYIPQVGIFGDFADNSSTGDHQNKAWMFGAYMGNSKINGWGTWRLQSYYKVIERDAWLDVLPDADFYSGGTNVAGWRQELDIGLAKNVWFDICWFRSNIFKTIPGIQGVTATNTNPSEGAPNNTFQMDLNFNF